jgi:hypothetical protein
MLVTLALLVFLSSIVVFFSEEFIRLFKKFFAIKGTKLLFPLFALSWLIYSFDFWVMWGIFYVREKLYDALNYLVHIMPFRQGAMPVALVLMLTVLSVAPVFILDVHSRRRNYKGHQYPYITSGIIWILCVALLIII